MIRKQIVFNEDNPHHMELLNWVDSQTTNFSGFVRDILFLYKNQTGTSTNHPVKQTSTPSGIFDIL